MPVTQSGDYASSTVHGTINDIGRDQYNYFGHPATPNSRLEAINQILKKLDPADMDATHRKGCLHGTRTDIIDFIMEWVNITDLKRQHNVLWLRGLAGSGKSTLSTTIANSLSVMERLAAFIFFERDVSIRSDPSAVIRTLAYKVGVSHPVVGEAISANVTKYPEIVHFPLQSQFQHLLVQPLTLPGVINSASPVVFVLDALDECGTPDERETLLELLAEQASVLPALFVITGRPSQDICGFFEDRDHILIKELDITTKNNNEDISTFLIHNLKRIRTKHPSLRRREHWPGDERLEKLLCRASGLFIWAATACKFIDKYPPDSRLEMIIKGPTAPAAEHTLDALYRTALESAGSWDIPEFVADFRAVLGFVLIAKHPLPGNAIISLLGRAVTESCIDVISQLGCVLRLDPTVRLLHPSFADFLFDPQRCIEKEFFFQEDALHHAIALLCIALLESVLKENLCGLTLSQEPVQAKLSEDVAYACMYWVEHVCVTRASAAVLTLIEGFLQRHLLHWVEAMSVQKRLSEAIRLLQCLLVWIPARGECPYLLMDLVSDGIRFLRRHVDAIKTHPLLIYSSALPFTPDQTSLYKTFHDTGAYPVLRGLVEGDWSLLSQELSGHTGPVYSIAFTPDGTRIISGSGDCTIRVWDSSSGIQVLPPLRGHDKCVRSVALSSDGTRIASVSDDRTVRVWDTFSGAQVLLISMLMHNINGRANSVVFSSDCKSVIFGSDDNMIHVRDATSGAEVRPPFKGHTSKVLSISISHDGTRIASGSAGGTIRVWDITSGLEVLPALEGHTSEVRSVAFSSDGKYIASASEDHTVRLWSAASGVCIDTPFQGHARRVWSVAFSHTWNCIASCSDDKTIRLWHATGAEAMSPLVYNDILYSISFAPSGTPLASGSFNGTIQVWLPGSGTGQPVRKPENHSRCVNSVAFSTDGTRAVSGSYDRTVRVWDTASGAQILPPLRGHDNTIWSVAVSPDGTRLASASSDETVRVWDITTGSEVFPPLYHQRWGKSVAFSDDGCYIISYDGDDQKYVWNAESGTRISDKETVRSMVPASEFNLDKDGWISDRLTKRPLSRLPSTVRHNCHTSHGKTLVVGDQAGNVFFIHFPSEQT